MDDFGIRIFPLKKLKSQRNATVVVNIPIIDHFFEKRKINIVFKEIILEIGAID